MPRAFLVKRRPQSNVAFPGDTQAQVPNKVIKSNSPIKPLPIRSALSTTELPSSRLFDLHEVELFNKCHSQFHQYYVTNDDRLSKDRYLKYNQSICEQVEYFKKAKSIEDLSKQLKKSADKEVISPTELQYSIFNLPDRKQVDSGRDSNEEVFVERIQTTDSLLNPTHKATIPPVYVTEILAKQRQKILAKHVVNIHNGFFAKKVSRRGRNKARQPIPGLEYIQNGTDMQYRNNTSLESSFATDDNAEDNAKTDGELNESEAKQTQRKYVCDICNKGFSRSNTLVTHKRIHTGDKPFECEICGRAFRQPGNLTRHRLIHTTVKPYKCSQCGKAFNRASNLHTHMRTHTNYKPFVCQYCGKGFHQKIDMKIHSYTHTGEKPHKCKKCGRGFKQLTHLTYHMRTHSDVKMYTCTYCGKGFNQKGNLQAHIYGHTGERPYRCELCGKGFTLASTLNTHRRTHANRLAIPTFTSNTLSSYGALHLSPKTDE
ncbi:uncharacterized protein [Antedon mediterranea]|uniref:uncharacterized protein n=1 Tax=Antedon mediterranea TaxID=105859 RepID=UPI003AF57662